MTVPESFKSQRGAVRLGLADILIALILLGVLLFVSYLQFPAYRQSASPPPSPSGGATAKPK